MNQRIKVAISPGPILMGMIVWAILSFVLLNIRDYRPPISVSSVEARGYINSGFLVIEYDRSFIVKEPFNGVVTRIVECNNVRTFDIADITRKFEVGAYHTKRTISIPYVVPVGSQCALRTMVTWAPLFKLRPITFSIPEASFVVEKK